VIFLGMSGSCIMVLAMMGKPEAMLRICEMEGFLSSIYMVGEHNNIT